MTKKELREASTDAIFEELDYCGYDGYYREYREEIITELRRRLERPKAKWITKYHGYPAEPSTICEKCGYDIDFEIYKCIDAESFGFKAYRPKYCPNCGAEMEV